MPITVKHQPGAGALAAGAYVSGLGEYRKERDKFQFAVDQYKTGLAEQQRQFDASQQLARERMAQQGRQFSASLGAQVMQRREQDRLRMGLARADAYMQGQQMVMRDRQFQQQLGLRQEEMALRDQQFQQQVQSRENMEIAQQMRMLQVADMQNKYRMYQGKVNAVMDSWKHLTPAQREEVQAQLNSEAEALGGVAMQIPTAPEAPPPPPPATVTFLDGTSREFTYGRADDGTTYLEKPEEYKAAVDARDAELARQHAMELKQLEIDAAAEKATTKRRIDLEAAIESAKLTLRKFKERKHSYVAGKMQSLTAAGLEADVRESTGLTGTSDDPAEKSAIDNAVAVRRGSLHAQFARDWEDQNAPTIERLEEDVRKAENDMRTYNAAVVPEIKEAPPVSALPRSVIAEVAGMAGKVTNGLRDLASQVDWGKLPTPDGPASEPVPSDIDGAWIEAASLPPIAPRPDGDSWDYKLDGNDIDERLRKAATIWERHGATASLGLPPTSSDRTIATVPEVVYQEWRKMLWRATYIETPEQYALLRPGQRFVYWDSEAEPPQFVEKTKP